MFLKITKIPVLLPFPSDIDSKAAAQLLGLVEGRFGEMATMMNYEYQDQNWREQNNLSAAHALIANIAVEKRGHLEIVRAMFHGLLSGKDADAGVSSIYAPGLDASAAKWTQEYFFWSGNLVLDLMHNFFLVNGACAHKVRVYEKITNLAVREMIGYLYMRDCVHMLAYAKALESLSGMRMSQLLSSLDLQTTAWPEVRKYREQPLHHSLYWFTERDSQIQSMWPENAPWDCLENLHSEPRRVDAESAGGEQWDDNHDADDYVTDDILEMVGQLYSR